MVFKIIKARVKKIGLPPGSLVLSNERKPGKIQISLIDYDAESYIEKIDCSVEDCLPYLKSKTITWINVCGISDASTVEKLGRMFGLHPLMLEDIMSVGQRSKLDQYKDVIYIVMKLLKYNEEHKHAEDEQVSLILGKNYVISFIESPQDIFKPIRDRLRPNKSHFRQRGADYLCYALIDCVVDNYFLILERVDEKLEKLEDELFDEPDSKTLQKIQHSKREIIMLRKSVWPVREVISNFRRLDTPLIQDSTKLYIQDVYDHTIQAIDTIESFRDIVAGMLDIYISSISLRMNEIMKVLTILATIFVPMTFIASLYGMNFDYMPELHHAWGYPAVLGLMLLLSGVMVYYFKRKGWL